MGSEVSWRNPDVFSEQDLNAEAEEAQPSVVPKRQPTPSPWTISSSASEVEVVEGAP